MLVTTETKMLVTPNPRTKILVIYMAEHLYLI